MISKLHLKLIRTNWDIKILVYLAAAFLIAKGYV